jgi:hypothetical protein
MIISHLFVCNQDFKLFKNRINFKFKEKFHLIKLIIKNGKTKFLKHKIKETQKNIKIPNKIYNNLLNNNNFFI